jgi:molybdopterin synthase sulfur carrier subunit
VIAFRIPGYLRPFTEGQAEVTVDVGPGPVRDALAALFARYPGVRDRVVTETGEVRQHVNVFVGDEAIRFTGGLETPVPEGAKIHIVPAVSGG